MKKYNRVCARVDLDAIEYNVDMMKNNIQENTEMIAVLKTDAYGHGAIQIAKLLEAKSFIWGYAVATADEAMILRERNIKKPILVLGYVFPEQMEDMIQNEIRFTCFEMEMAVAISEMARKLNKEAILHIKLDTGMGRIGFFINEDCANKIVDISKLPGLKLEGMFTHFAKADEIDKTYTNMQIEKYVWMKNRLCEKGITFSYYHTCNSAGIIDVKEANMDLVRAGISIYGLYPSEEVIKENVPLKPAMSLISHVVFVKEVEAGTAISYGGTYVTDKPTVIATIPVGYGDGYPRSLSNKGYVLIHGKKAPICGRVCMDQFMVDVTNIENVKAGDEVVLVGHSGDENLPVEVLSDLSGRFNYEFVCCLSKRIPREYIKDNQIVKQLDYFI